jgi:hypothetical protein
MLDGFLWNPIKLGFYQKFLNMSSLRRAQDRTEEWNDEASLASKFSFYKKLCGERF